MNHFSVLHGLYVMVCTCWIVCHNYVLLYWCVCHSVCHSVCHGVHLLGCVSLCALAGVCVIVSLVPSPYFSHVGRRTHFTQGTKSRA